MRICDFEAARWHRQSALSLQPTSADQPLTRFPQVPHVHNVRARHSFVRLLSRYLAHPRPPCTLSLLSPPCPHSRSRTLSLLSPPCPHSRSRILEEAPPRHRHWVQSRLCCGCGRSCRWRKADALCQSGRFVGRLSGTGGRWCAKPARCLLLVAVVCVKLQPGFAAALWRRGSVLGS